MKQGWIILIFEVKAKMAKYVNNLMNVIETIHHGLQNKNLDNFESLICMKFEH